MFLHFFGFSENPFNLTPDPRFLFLTDSHQEALASMRYAITERKGFISISGEVGTGKTTLIRHLLNTLGPKVKTVLVYQTLISFEDLLKEILLELELSLGDQSKTSLTRHFNEYLIEKLARGETLALIIDEAQNLSTDVLEGLRLLSNLETERSKLLQIVLVGQPELEEKLNSGELRQLKQRIGIRRKISPLTEEESARYIEHRLNKVGSSIQNVLTPQAVSLICQYAGGIPRVINVLCDNAFLIGYALGKKKIDGNILKEVLSDMGMLPGKLRVAQEVMPKRPPTEQITPSLAEDSSYSAIRRKNGFVVNGLTDRNRPIEYRRLNRSDTEIDRESSRYKKPAVFVCVVLGVLLAGFLAKEYWLGSTEKLGIEASPPVAVPKGPSIPPKQEDRIKSIITVEKGETISSLAKKYYGLANPTVLDHILTLNQDITNLHLIREHQKIRLPEIIEDSLITQPGDGTYEIWLGTFSEPEQAGYLKRQPSLGGRAIELLQRKVSSDETWYRAVAGNFETREECLKSIQRLREQRLLPAFRE